MEPCELNIPDISFKNDFTIYYKGDEDQTEQATGSIIEIKTSKEEFLRKLRYFKRKTTEINNMNELFIHDKYSVSTFEMFIKSLQTNKIKVDENNYNIILELSHKYEYYELEEEISKFVQKRPDIDLIIREGSKKTIDPLKEEKLSKHLDICLRNENFIQFPIQVLARILNSPGRVLNDHHLLFQFIKKLIKIFDANQNENENNANLEIILSSLDLLEMSDEELDELFNNKYFFNIFQCHHSKERMKSVFDENKYIKKRISELETRILNLENQFQKEKINKIDFDEMKSKIEKQEKIISKYQNQNDQLQQLIQKQDEKLTKIEKSLQDFDKLKTKISKQDKFISKITELKCSITAKIEQNQTIKGTIKIDGNIHALDTSLSKYILNSNNSPKLNEREYKTGKEISSLTQEFSFNCKKGTYFLHAIIYSTYGDFEELISQPFTIKEKVILTFNYTGHAQSVKLEPGKYKLEVWGAEGGHNDQQYNGGIFKGFAGKGGYSTGTLNLKDETTLYVYVGGSSTSNSGGWNGGGSSLEKGAGGGGSTDISLYGEDGSSEWNSPKHINSRMIVAGGGGGSSLTSYSDWKGGCGGGFDGENNGYGKILGGSQNKGFQFGLAESNTNSSYHNSGGGGGWYGGHACNNNGWWGHGGGGGSGFVYNSSTSSNYPSGCMLNSSFYLENSETICGNTDIPATTGNDKENGHQGNGYAKITPLY